MNKKGFTLIELLAAIVIIGLISSIAIGGTSMYLDRTRQQAYDAMQETLYSAAQNAANNLNTWVVEDAVISNNSDKKLGDTFQSTTMTGDWICLSTTLMIENGTSAQTSLLNALGLSTKDIKIGTTLT